MQSNHTRQVAAGWRRRIGFKCRLVQESWVPHEDAVYDRVGNILLSRILGADVRLVDEGFDIGIRHSWEEALEDVRAHGGKAVPDPGRAHPCTLWAGWATSASPREVRIQEQQLGFRFDYIVVCTVTGSTHAGMLVGFKADGRGQARDRHRRLRDPRPRPGPRSWTSPGAPPGLVELGTPILDEDLVLPGGLCLPGLRGALRGHQGRHPAMRPPRGDDDRPGSTRGNPCRGSSTWCARGSSPAAPGCSMPHLGGVPAINGYSYAFRNG